MSTARALTRATVEAVVAGRHRDPFAVLGVHPVGNRLLLRAFVPGADHVDVTTRDGEPIATLSQRHVAGFFEGTIEKRTRYLLRARNRDAQWIVDDIYAYGPVLGPLDAWLLGEGKLLNTDAAVYGGSGVGNAGLVMAKPTPLNGQAWSATLTLPPLAVLWIAPEQD